MRELIARCLDDDNDAWRRLWEVAAAPIRRQMPRPRAGDPSADDAEQEFYLFLREDDGRRLRAFRGESEGEFRGYIRAVARNFLSSYLAARRRAEAREARARPAVARPEAGAATEPQVLAALREFLNSAPAEERRRLLAFLAPGGAEGVAPRTLRRWQQGLVASYALRVL